MEVIVGIVHNRFSEHFPPLTYFSGQLPANKECLEAAGIMLRGWSFAIKRIL